MPHEGPGTSFGEMERAHSGVWGASDEQGGPRETPQPQPREGSNGGNPSHPTREGKVGITKAPWKWKTKIQLCSSPVGLPRLQPLCFNTFQAFVLILVVRGLQDMPGQEGEPWLSHTQIKKIRHLAQEMPAQTALIVSFFLPPHPPPLFFFSSQKIHQGLPCPCERFGFGQYQ